MRAITCGAVLALAAAPAFAQSQFEKYQKMTAEGSPVELFELVGEDLWKKPQGPNNVSLEKCDLGKGPGVLKGAYAALPRYFKDVDRVMDLETRLLHCMTTLQGRSREEAFAELRLEGRDRAEELTRHGPEGRQLPPRGEMSADARELVFRIEHKYAGNGLYSLLLASGGSIVNHGVIAANATDIGGTVYLAAASDIINLNSITSDARNSQMPILPLVNPVSRRTSTV